MCRLTENKMFHVIIYPFRHSNRIFIYSVFFSFIISFVCHGQTVTNYGQWKNLSTSSKTLYVSGMIDYILNASCDNCLERANGIALSRCINEFRITNPEIAIMIDNFYFLNQNWKYSPQVAVTKQLINGVCQPYFN